MSDTAKTLRDQVEPIVEGAGYQVVELSSGVVKGRPHVTLVVYHPDGVSIDDCAELHRTILPRIELLLDSRDVALQIASPGIERTLKHEREYAVFVGRGVQLLIRDDGWVGGRIVASTGTAVEIQTGEGVRTFAFHDIQKAKLDYTQEVR